MKKRILTCSLELFNEFGIKGLTMDAIAAKLGISKRTLYEHFGCKEELLTVCLQLHLDNCKLFTFTANELIDELLALYTRMRNINLTNAHRFCRELQKFYAPVYKILMDQLLDYASLCSEKVADGIDNGYIRRDVHPSIVCAAVVGYMTPLFALIEQDNKTVWRTTSPEIIIIFTRGLCTIKGRNYMEQKLKEITQ